MLLCHQVRSVWTLLRKTGTLLTGHLQTSLRSLSAFSSFPSPRAVSMRRQVASSWKAMKIFSATQNSTHQSMPSPTWLSWSTSSNTSPWYAKPRVLQLKKRNKKIPNNLDRKQLAYSASSLTPSCPQPPLKEKVKTLLPMACQLSPSLLPELLIHLSRRQLPLQTPRRSGWDASERMHAKGE